MHTCRPRVPNTAIRHIVIIFVYLYIYDQQCRDCHFARIINYFPECFRCSFIFFSSVPTGLLPIILFDEFPNLRIISADDDGYEFALGQYFTLFSHVAKWGNQKMTLWSIGCGIQFHKHWMHYSAEEPFECRIALLSQLWGTFESSTKLLKL